MAAESPFHVGEQRVQEQLGVRDIEHWARKVVRPFLPDEHRQFHTSLPFLVAAARDAEGRPLRVLEVPMPTPTSAGKGMHHLGLATHDMEATLDFYEGVLGFPAVVCETNPLEKGGVMRHAFLDAGGGELIAFMEFNGVEVRGEPFDFDAGITEVVDHGWCRSIYFLDPNGLQLEFCHLSAEPGEPHVAERHAETWRRWARR
jgi:catechol 2,3-dioxygenase-like lactoylglutathione lyase family enzyme